MNTLYFCNSCFSCPSFPLNYITAAGQSGCVNVMPFNAASIYVPALADGE